MSRLAFTTSKLDEVVSTMVDSVKKIAEDTFEVTFKIPNPQWTFQPGQYISITLPTLIEHDPRGNSRDFSISSFSDNNKITVAFRNSGSGFKKTILASPRVKVEIRGPFGVFTLPAEHHQPLVLIAGGIGITPFICMVKHVIAKNTKHRITILSTNSSKSKAPYARQLRELDKTNPNLSVNQIVGPLSREIMSNLVNNIVGSKYYIAGTQNMIRHTLELLREMEVPLNSIMIEEFSGYLSGDSIYDPAGHDERVIPQAFDDYIDSELTDRPRTDIDAILKALGTTALVSETNAQGTITFANDKFIEISKYPREELIGYNHRILKSGNHPKAFYDNLWATITRGKLWRGQFKNKAKDGSYYWVDTSIAPILGKDGRPEKYISVRFPITERQYAEEKLQEQAKQQNALTTLSREALGNPDIDSLFNITITLLTQTLGLEYGAVLKACHDEKSLIYQAATGFDVKKKEVRIPAGHKDSVAGYVLHSEEPVVIEDLSTESRFSGSALLHDSSAVSGVAVLIQGQDDPYGVLEVFTTRKRIFSQDEDIAFIQAVANLLANAIRNQELDRRKDEFLGMASHELKTPLTSLKTFAQLLQRHAEEINDKNTISYAKKIIFQTDRQANLINNLLDLSRLNSGKLQYKDSIFKLQNVIQKTAEEMQMTTTKHTIIINNSVSNYIYGDRSRIGQVLSNLISNAIKYSPNGGNISITCQIKGGNVITRVTDEGIGISPEEQKKIFRRFSQGTPQKIGNFSNGGLGLGLHIAKQIVDRYDGEIWVKSRRGKGSTFSFSLPLYAKANE